MQWPRHETRRRVSDPRVVVHDASGGVEARSVVLSIHGLNQHADALASLTSVLRSSGATVVSLCLRGHARATGAPSRQDALPTWRAVRWTDWQEDWDVGAQVAADLARDKGLPLNFLGYSLGGLVHVHQLAYSTLQLQFNAQVLLAPALRVRTYAHMVRLLQPLGADFLIPTLVPEPIRSHSKTSVAAYQALFDLHERLNHLENADALRVPTLVAMDRADEVVSAAGIERWATELGLLPWWRFEWITKDRTTANSRKAHYITDPYALGTNAHERLASQLCDVLAPGTDASASRDLQARRTGSP